MKDFKRIFALVKPYWGRLVVAGVCSVIVSGLNGSLAWLVKPAVDKVFVSRESTFLVLLSLYQAINLAEFRPCIATISRLDAKIRSRKLLPVKYSN